MFLFSSHIQKTCSAFLNNDNFDFYELCDGIISHVLSNYTVKHQDNNVFVSFGHIIMIILLHLQLLLELVNNLFLFIFVALKVPIQKKLFLLILLEKL